MAKAKIHWVVRRVAALALVLASSAIVWAQDAPASPQRDPQVRLGPPFSPGKNPDLRRGLLEAWKEKRARERRVVTPLGISAPVGAVGRASMVINTPEVVSYTKVFLGTGATCDPNIEAKNVWSADNSYAAGDVVRPSGSFSTPNGFDGFNFQAQNSGLSSSTTEPTWPKAIGSTVNDNGIIWKAIAFDPTWFVGCTPMQLISRTVGGIETIIAKESDVVAGTSGAELGGWNEFHAMNSSGLVAFRAALAGWPFNDGEDEGESAIVTAGPGAGNLKKIAATGDTVGGRKFCGFSAMVGMNNAGQIVFDGLATKVANKCDEDNHALIRFTPGATGNQLLVAQGSSVGGSTVIGFGNDDDSGLSCSGCEYNNIDGFINASGRVPVVLNLSDGSQGVFIFSGPGTSIQAARTGVGGITALRPRVAINDSNQVSFIGTSGGVEHVFRFTPPSTLVTIASVGDTLPGSIDAVAGFGPFTDINNSGNVVFQANFPVDGSAPAGYYFYDGAVDEIFVASGGLASEMVTVNDSNLVAYVTGNRTPEGTDDASEMSQTGGLFFWTKSGGSVNAISKGDGIGGGFVQTIYAQHPSFARRQLSESNCVATEYAVTSDDPDLDNTEGEVLAPGGQLFVSCGCAPITLSPAVLPSGTQGTPYSQTITASGAAPPVSFAITLGTQPTGLNLSSGGVLSGTPTATGTFNFDVTATDNNGCTGKQSYSVTIGTIVCPTITVNPASLPGGTTGVLYSQTITQTGGAVPATFAISSGTQPTGLNLASSTGKLTGTPTAAGTFNFDVTATDKNGCTGTRSYSVTIVCPTITLSPSSLPSGTINVPYSQTITQSGGATPVTFAITSGAQPTGTNLSSSGTLSGTPTAIGLFTFDVTATDKNGCTGVHTYSVQINPCIPFEGSPSLSISPSSADIGQIVKLTWTSIMSAGQGNYLVQKSVGGGPFSTIATIPSSNALTMTFSFTAASPTGTQSFQVVAVLTCDPKGAVTSNQVNLAVSAPVTPPTCNALPAPAGLTVSPNPVIPGQAFTLSWQPAPGADHYDVSISTDGGATFTSLGFVYLTSFTGIAPSSPRSSLIFDVDDVSPCGSVSAQTSVTIPIGQACIAPEPVTNITVQANGVTPPRPPSPTEYILVSWTPSATGTRPTRYSVRINGDPEIFVVDTSVVLPPRGTADPITAFVTPYGCAALTSAETFDPASSSWSTTGNLGLPRQEHTATLLSTGKVLVAGGVPNLFSPPSPTAELFDPVLNRWTPTGTLATPRAEQSASALGTSSAGTATGTRSVAQVGSQVLVEGGAGTSPLASSELYDATAGTWSGVGDLANARDLHTATVLQDGRVLVAGGLASGPLSSAEIYDPSTKVWTSTGSLATARYRHTATLLSNGKVLVAGGFGNAGALASAELFDPAVGTWTATGSLATARQAHSAALLSSGKVLAEGGDDGTNPLSSAELYDPAAGTWSATGGLIAARRNHTSTVLADGKILVAGGFGTDLANALKSSELYDPTAGTFSAAGALRGAHGFHSATLLGNGKVLVAGAADKLGIEQVGTTADSGPIALFLSPPVASFTISANPAVGAPVTFTDTSTPQATSWLWIFDEGTENDPDPTKRLTSTLQSPTHVYTNAGTHQVTLVASNGAGSSNATQDFNVAAASSVNRVVVSHTVQFDMTDPTRRRVAIQLTGPNNTFLTLNTSESSETIVFLRFLDPGGKLVAERRLSVQPGSPAVYDLGAYGFTGRFSIELVSGKQFTSSLNVRGRNVREIHR